MRGRNLSAVQIRDRTAGEEVVRSVGWGNRDRLKALNPGVLGRAPSLRNFHPYKARLCSILSGQRMVNWRSASRQPCTVCHFLDVFCKAR